MKDEYLIFKEFNDIEIASDIAELLKRNKIETIIENNKKPHSVFGTNNFNNDIKLKISSNNFLFAQSIIENYYKELVSSAPEDYYLFQFSKEELIEIIQNPWDWGEFDVHLAEKILIDNGVEINPNEKKERINEYIKNDSKHQNVNKVDIIWGYIFAIAGGFGAILYGYNLIHSKKTLINGEQVFSYGENERKHGKIIQRFGIVCLVLWVMLILFSKYNNAYT